VCTAFAITSFKFQNKAGTITPGVGGGTISIMLAPNKALTDIPVVIKSPTTATVTPSGSVTFVNGTAQDFVLTYGNATKTYAVTVSQ
jgi:hypothetical protein